MSNSDKDARALQDATGAKYTVCLSYVRQLRTSGNLDAFMDRVDDLDDLAPGQIRCIRCLANIHTGACS